VTSVGEQCILITGASSGLGRATAELFASRGWRVIATMRSPQRESALAEVPGVELVQLDTTDADRIAEVAVAYARQVDVVFNNAGYGMSGPLEGLSDAQIVRMVNTNLLGPIRLTKAFVPYWRDRGSGLFINTTSIGGLIAVPFNSIYHATKWGLEGWSESIAFELGRVGIGVKILEPGGMKTDFFTRSLDSATHPAYDSLLDHVMAAVSDPQVVATYSTPEHVAEVVLEAATDGSSRLRYLAGDDAQSTYAARRQMSDEEFRAATTERFFGDA
jgi:NAD(P)-dependent dehydrogenase (short-subunit alcohol dehydrogenase family)